MTYRFVAATDDTRPLTVAVSIAGGSGTGKTYSALRLARGLAGGKPFGVIDTENRRALHYRAEFPEMMHLDLSPMNAAGEMVGFPPERWIEVLDAAEAAGLPALVIDSFSHAWEGINGVLELQAAAVERMARGDSAKAERVGQLAWAEVKPRFRRLVDRIIRSRCHIVICIRAKPVMQKPGGGNARPTKLRRPDLAWDIAADKDLVFEMTGSILMVPERPGEPVLLKCADQFKSIFGAGGVLTEQAGEQMAAWAAGGGAGPKALLDEARAAARQGRAAFERHWKGLSRADRATVKIIMDELKESAEEADRSSVETDDPFGTPAAAGPERTTETPQEPAEPVANEPASAPPAEAAPVLSVVDADGLALAPNLTPAGFVNLLIDLGADAPDPAAYAKANGAGIRAAFGAVNDDLRATLAEWQASAMKGERRDPRQGGLGL